MVQMDLGRRCFSAIYLEVGICDFYYSTLGEKEAK